MSVFRRQKRSFGLQYLDMPTIAKKAGGSLRKTAAGTPAQLAPQTLTPQEAESRRAAVETARGLLAIEGLTPSAEAQADDAAWVRGELTMEEKIERTRARARLVVAQES